MPLLLLHIHYAMSFGRRPSAIEGLYVITDEQLRPPRTHVEIARAAVAGGASVVQLRDKHSTDEDLIRTCLQIRAFTRESGVLFVVNDRADVALECDADGLHVGQSDHPAAELRSLFEGRVLGVSVANAEEAKRAADAGADYLGVGPVFPTDTKSDAGESVGLRQISAMREASGGLAIVAIGGINESNIADVARVRADAAAVISAVVCAEDMVAAVSRLTAIWKQTAPNR